MRSMQEEINRSRTFAIISHPDAGKTTLTEKFLLYGGANRGLVRIFRFDVLFQSVQKALRRSPLLLRKKIKKILHYVQNDKSGLFKITE